MIVLSFVAFVYDSTKTNFVSLKTSLRWICSLRFRKVSVTERMHTLRSRFAQYSCKVTNCTSNLFSSKSLRYIAMASLYSWMKISFLASHSKRFSVFTYVLKSSWLIWSSIALMIRSKDSKYLLQLWEITSLAYSGAAFLLRNSSILVGALLFLGNFSASTSNCVACCFTSSQNRW